MSCEGQARPKKSGRPSKLDDVSTEATCDKLGGDKRIQASGPDRQKPLEDEVEQAADGAQKPPRPSRYPGLASCDGEGVTRATRLRFIGARKS